MTIPLSLYIHLPWCQRKCPYCDFNSHEVSGTLPEQAYVAALIRDLEHDLPYVQGRAINSIYFGGGTPSLFSPKALTTLLDSIAGRINLISDCEITLEANPGTVFSERIQEFRHAGINRLSLGVQSFQNDKLTKLGRIHSAEQASAAVTAALQAGFNSVNLDLMYGLPQHSLEDAIYDLTTAINLHPQHLSWYQLTLEPNTVFYKSPPTLPPDEAICDIEIAGRELLAQHGYMQYEVSAYAKQQIYCQHNINYWMFGDYLGIGAGAHSKVTDLQSLTITRLQKVRQPNDYLNPTKSFIADQHVIEKSDLGFEFMLNALRLYRPISEDLLLNRTGSTFTDLQIPLQKACEKGLLQIDNQQIQLTELGKQFLNDVMTTFL